MTHLRTEGPRHGRSQEKSKDSTHNTDNTDTQHRQTPTTHTHTHTVPDHRWCLWSTFVIAGVQWLMHKSSSPPPSTKNTENGEKKKKRQNESSKWIATFGVATLSLTCLIVKNKSKIDTRELLWLRKRRDAFEQCCGQFVVPFSVISVLLSARCVRLLSAGEIVHQRHQYTACTFRRALSLDQNNAHTLLNRIQQMLLRPDDATMEVLGLMRPPTRTPNIPQRWRITAQKWPLLMGDMAWSWIPCCHSNAACASN